MDDSTFHHELIQLKKRVSQMAFTYNQRSPASHCTPVTRDGFCDQLHEVKSRLQSMQNCFDQMTTAQNYRQVPQDFQSLDPADMQPSNTNLLPHSRLSLPSGPLFWQLFSSLRTDVRGLDSRVANIEQDVSDLEDRVDDLNPHRLTPPASENEIYASPLWEQNFAPPLSPHGSTGWSNQGNSVPTNQNWYSHQVNHNVSELDTQFSFPKPMNYQTDILNANVSTQPGNSNFGPQARGMSAPEGVAFRDREITQLEELLRDTQDSLTHAEALANDKDSYIEQVTAERSHAESRITELERMTSDHEGTIQAYRRLLNAKHGEVERLQTEAQSRDAALEAWAYRHHAIQQSYLRKKTQLCTSDRQVQQLQRVLYNLQSSRRDEVDELIGSKDDEIEKLRVFCESKDTVVYQQDDVIARGAALLEERDDELERVNRQLRVLDDDYKSETRERTRVSELMEERNAEIAQLKAALTHALTPEQMQGKPKRNNGTITDCDPDREDARPMPISPFATAGQRQASDTGQWTPRAFDNYAKLPHEMMRASAWEAGPGSTRQRFGVPGVMTVSAGQQSSRGRESERRELRHSDSLKLLQRLALVEEGRHARASDDPATAISRDDSMQELPRRRRLLQAYVEEGENGGERAER